MARLLTFGYNHRGERVLRAPEGGNAQITVYDEAGQWLGNYSATGRAQQQAIWLDNYPVALINVAGHLMKFMIDGRTGMYDVTSTNPRRTVPLPGWEGNIMAEHLGLPDDRVRESIKRRLKCK